MTEFYRRIRCLKNAEEIGEYIGEGSRSIGRLVLDENLPALKRNGFGPWRVIDIDLDRWLVAQARKFLPAARMDAETD